MFMGKSLFLSEAWFSRGLYWDQRILNELNEFMNLKVRICKECFIYSIMPETKPRLPCYGAWDLILLPWPLPLKVGQYLVSAKMQGARILLSALPGFLASFVPTLTFRSSRKFPESAGSVSLLRCFIRHSWCVCQTTGIFRPIRSEISNIMLWLEPSVYKVEKNVY